jgi:hypothetical protein
MLGDFGVHVLQLAVLVVEVDEEDMEIFAAIVLLGTEVDAGYNSSLIERVLERFLDLFGIARLVRVADEKLSSCHDTEKSLKAMKWMKVVWFVKPGCKFCTEVKVFQFSKGSIARISPAKSAIYYKFSEIQSFKHFTVFDSKDAK